MQSAEVKKEVKSNVYQKIAELRLRVLEARLKKSGKNPAFRFEYFELDDFLPTVTKEMMNLGLSHKITVEPEFAKLRVIDTDNIESFDETTIPVPVLPQITNLTQQSVTTWMQSIGTISTYSTRYLFIRMLNLAEPDSIDASIGMPQNNVSRTENIVALNRELQECFDSEDENKKKDVWKKAKKSGFEYNKETKKFQLPDRSTQLANIALKA